MMSYFLNKIMDYEDIDQYKDCVIDLLEHEAICSMKNYIQHSDISCFEHSLTVSYYSYCICKKWGLDYRSAARGGLLHDLFLYDWHTTKTEGLHGFTHPYTALKNASDLFELNEKEKDIIVKHMWPLTIKCPSFKESFVVTMVDKWCAVVEICARKKMCARLELI